jgi:transposase
MRTQTKSTRAARSTPDKRRRYREPTQEEVAVLRLIAEQVAIPLGQLARFLDVEPEQAKRIVAGLARAGCVEQRRFLAGDPPWVWPTRRGARLSGTGFGPLAPTVRWLTHRRAVNEVRLYLAERAPEGRWVCERAVERLLEPNLPKPDAVFEIGGERHAIEAELSRKPRPALRTVIASHSNRYDAVLYFCSPQARSLLDEMRELQRWPKLIVRDVPGLERILTTRSRGFGVPLREPRRPKHVQWRHRRKLPRLPQPWERRVLQLICEQGAIPLDQLTRFLDCEVAVSERIAEHLCEAKFAKRGRLLADEPDWVWLTDGGTRLSEAGLKPYLPAPGALARLRAINEVRLRVDNGSSQARWIGWRTLRRELSGSGRIPNAVVEIGDERHAIEVELTRKEKEDAVRMIAHRSANYDAVVCFCTAKTRRFYERLAAENHWPKLVIHKLPAPDAGRVPPAIEGDAKKGRAPGGRAASSSAPPPTPSQSRWGWCADEFDAEVLLQKAAPTSSAVASGSRSLLWQPAANPQRTEVDDGLWAELEPLIPKHGLSGPGSKTKRMPDRTALSGILYIARNKGIAWPDLPHELGYGSGITCWERLRQWERVGAWAEVRQLLQAKLDDADRIAWSKIAPAASATRSSPS